MVLLELAMVRWAIEKLIAEGFEPVIPPVLVRERALIGTGMLPDTEQQIYQLPNTTSTWQATSEVALASLHRDEILDADRLPLRYAGFSPCFRREAGAAGKDTRGIFPGAPVRPNWRCSRFVEPDQSAEEHQRILAIEESILSELEIPTRVVAIAVDDLGASAFDEVRLRGLAPRPGPVPRADLVLENTTRTSRRAAWTSATAPAAAGPATLHTLQRHGRHLAAHDRAPRETGSRTMDRRPGLRC